MSSRLFYGVGWDSTELLQGPSDVVPWPEAHWIHRGPPFCRIGHCRSYS